MVILIGATVVVAALFAAWVAGEVKNIRALRMTGAMAPLLLVPLAYFWGSAAGHERAYVYSRGVTSEFLGSMIDALRVGNSERVIVEAERLRRGADGHPKGAGGFFHRDLETATESLAEHTIRHGQAQ